MGVDQFHHLPVAVEHGLCLHEPFPPLLLPEGALLDHRPCRHRRTRHRRLSRSVACVMTRFCEVAEMSV